MHPPKVSTFDVPARVNIDNKGLVRPVDEYRETPFGLYMSRAMVNRPTADWMQTWLLPELGIAVTDWWWTPGHVRDQDFYLDIGTIERHGDRWTLTDHYLDIVVRTGRDAEVLDVDEFVTAVALGLLDAADRRDGDAPQLPRGRRDRRPRPRPRRVARGVRHRPRLARPLVTI